MSLLHRRLSQLRRLVDTLHPYTTQEPHPPGRRITQHHIPHQQPVGPTPTMPALTTRPLSPLHDPAPYEPCTLCGDPAPGLICAVCRALNGPLLDCGHPDDTPDTWHCDDDGQQVCAACCTPCHQENP